MQAADNLKVTRKAEELAVLVYRATREFPREERYGLTSQVRRAATSVGSNIAEGCGRSGDLELAQFLQYSLGSASELEFQLRVAARLGMGDPVGLMEVREATAELKRMLSRLIVHLRQASRQGNT